MLVRVASENKGVAASVTDFGPCIPAENQARLFQRFSRGTTGQTTGTGLGLYFVRTVAEKHGGSIAVESELERFTCFRLRVPLAQTAW